MVPTVALIPTLAMAPWVTGLLGVAYVLVCLMLILTVLIQRPQGGGLAGAFGSGAGSGQTAFGTKTGDALTMFTIVVFVLFVGMSIGLNFALRPSTNVEPTTAIEAPKNAPAQPAPAGETPASGAPASTAPAGGEPATTGAPAGGAPAVPPATQPAPAPTTAPAEKPAPPTTPPVTPKQ